MAAPSPCQHQPPRYNKEITKQSVYILKNKHTALKTGFVFCMLNVCFSMPKEFHILFSHFIHLSPSKLKWFQYAKKFIFSTLKLIPSTWEQNWQISLIAVLTNIRIFSFKNIDIINNNFHLYLPFKIRMSEEIWLLI